MSAFKQSEFPYPAAGDSVPPGLPPSQDGDGYSTGRGNQHQQVSGSVADEDEPLVRTAMSYVREISCLQARLHTANIDLDQTNSECVKLTEVNLALKRELVEAKAKARKFAAENTALKRQLSMIESDRVLPRPGPPLKPFSDLTPKHRIRATDELQAKVIKTSEERNILPTKLSAFLTHRFINRLFNIILLRLQTRNIKNHSETGL